MILRSLAPIKFFLCLQLLQFISQDLFPCNISPIYCHPSALLQVLLFTFNPFLKITQNISTPVPQLSSNLTHSINHTTHSCVHCKLPCIFHCRGALLLLHPPSLKAKGVPSQFPFSCYIIPYHHNNGLVIRMSWIPINHTKVRKTSTPCLIRHSSIQSLSNVVITVMRLVSLSERVPHKT